MSSDHGWAKRPSSFPSLHVGLSAICVSAYSVHASKFGQFFLWGWVVAVAVAAVLTYQHHLLDVITGFLVGVTVDRWGRRGGEATMNLGTSTT